jgi:lipopolysaccharide transport system ATP-binding protein
MNKILKVSQIRKKFATTTRSSIRYGIQDIFCEFVGKSTSQDLRAEEFWSLKDISFDLNRGECLGIIGSNGAGKSTLLKIISGIILPDSGTVKTEGRVCSLLEVRSGFHRKLTGRENIYLKGTIMGLRRDEIASRFEQIVDFSGLGSSIDMPMKFYSSGMNSRLGFAIAAHVSPDLLILDEVLAVGDRDFRMKCLSYINSILDDTAIIFVSHNMTQISRVCNRGIHLKDGKICIDGTISEAINSYQSTKQVLTDRQEQYSSFVQKVALQLPLSTAQDSDFDMSFEVVLGEMTSFHLEYNIINQEGINCISAISPKFIPDSKKISIQCKLSKIALSPGNYLVHVNVLGPLLSVRLASVLNAGKFQITGHYQSKSIYNQPNEWLEVN